MTLGKTSNDLRESAMKISQRIVFPGKKTPFLSVQPQTSLVVQGLGLCAPGAQVSYMLQLGPAAVIQGSAIELEKTLGIFD